MHALSANYAAMFCQVMLCGRYPFDGQKQALDEQIRTASYCMSGTKLILAQRC